MWRPEEGWENPYEYKDLIGDCQRTAFEAGADAMLEILREQGYDTMDSFKEESYCSGKVVFIPKDKEE